jgi:hypothetical protein
MTDKVQIKAIIKQYADKGKRLYAESYNEKKEKYAIGFWDGYKSCADGLLRELEDMQEEPVSEDLEQAIDTYLATYWGSEKEKQDWSFLKKMAIYFANWQKQQIIAKAVDGFVIEDIEEGNGDFLLSAEYLSKDMGLKDRQKVKVIVIKEN